MRRSVVFRGLVAVAAAQAAWLGYPYVRRVVLSVEDTPAARGYRLAADLGCFSCHGADGAGGCKNPGSQEGEVPAFTEQTQMMYVKTTQDLREYILDGAPTRRREDPDYRERMAAAALRMPAYRGKISAAQLEDLVAYLRATSGQLLPEDAETVRGAELVGEYHCLACHGPLGAGGVPNPGSFKGYIPGFWGEDYDELVRDDDELRQWIVDGRIPRIAEHPIGGIFFRRQATKMPAYGKFLDEADVRAIVAYVKWVRAGSWQPGLR